VKVTVLLAMCILFVHLAMCTLPCGFSQLENVLEMTCAAQSRARCAEHVYLSVDADSDTLIIRVEDARMSETATQWLWLA
jgi:hypothetical protein